MPNLGDFLRRQIVRINTDGALSTRQLGVVAGNIAKLRHQQLVQDGQLPEASIRYVDFSVNLPETAVRITKDKPGRIEYVGSTIAQAAFYVWTIANEASRNIPQRRSQFPAGTFARSWRLFADGREAPPSRIPGQTSQVIVANVTPYSRRLEQAVGLRKQKPAYMITEIATRAAQRKFSGLSIRRQFVSLSAVSGVPFSVPYHLQRPPGGEMIYPAIVLSVQDR